ncbi:MAG: hypothetical protein B7Y77_02160 [Bradyrhizobium sp. 35-63-5]|nr:MAG: hypothetical protein B7Y77_02160 [Bradyrhizobium sp. 35-63-5]
MADGDDLILLSLSSRSFAPKDRNEAFHETFGRQILKLEIDPLDDQLIDVEMQLRILPGLAVAKASISPIICRHTSMMIDNDDPVIAFVESGSVRFKQNGHETIAHAGDAILTTGGLVGTAEHTTGRMINCRISRSLIAPMVSNFDAEIGKLIDKGNPAIPFFLNYTNVVNASETIDARLRRAVVTHMLDLAALILGARGDAAEVAKNRGLRAARLLKLKKCIQADIGNPDLSLTSIADSNGISVTYVRKLFEADGTTFSEFMLAQRLAKAYELLAAPARLNETIAALANEAGFNDISYFNRTFRRAYNATPSEIRQAIRRKD